MSLHYILDGYNIMRHAAYQPRGKANDPRYGLIAFVRDEELCGSAKNTVTIVFDGFPSGFDYDDGRFRTIFSGDAKADDKIKAMIEASDRRKTIVVVSDDREIRGFAKIYGVKTEHVEEFVGGRRSARRTVDESAKPELTYEKMRRINSELRARWLK
jgi:hypothetical protein